MNIVWRKLDNAAKAFSLDEKKNNNIFRLSAILNDKVDLNSLKNAIKKTLDDYPNFRVKIKTGLFWNYLETNQKEPIVEEEKEISCKNIDFRKNSDYLFKISYFDNKINMDMFHVLTDGLGAKNFFKSILCNYLDLKYNLADKVLKKSLNNFNLKDDEYLKYADKSLACKENHKKAFLIKEKSNFCNNKTYHYILNLEKLKIICKNYKVSISEFLTAIYIYSIYNSIYDKSSNKDIIITVPIDLRKYYNIETFSNFFTCMYIGGNVLIKNVTFEKILDYVHNDYKRKLTKDNIKKYLANDVKLGTNIGLRLIPLFIKKFFMKYFGKMVCQSSTSTLSNIGTIDVLEKYKKYIDNVVVLVKSGRLQKVKCTICSYENNLTVTINSNLISNKLEDEFYSLLKKYVGEVRLESS